MNLKSIPFVFMLLFGCFTVRSQVPLQTTISKLSGYSTSHRTEKAYLQFDKPFYSAGDTMYFKAYVTMGDRHEMSTISGVLHVDLINSKNKIDQSLLLQLKDGLAWGDFALPDSLPKANYRVRAYTNWMRNEGADAFFERTIAIGSLQAVKIPESATRQPASVNNKADVQFFPEGGELVAGVRNKMAFKAVGSNGLGLEVKGVIRNSLNKEIGSFASSHLGMGWFILTPEEDETYSATVTYASGAQEKIDLPKPAKKGIVVTVTHLDSSKIAVSIIANRASFEENINKQYNLLVYSGGELLKLNCLLDNPVVNLAIPTEHLHTGIATVTLFSPGGDPLDERLLFVQKNDLLKLNLSSDKMVYGKREKISLRLNTDMIDTVSGHFSVSVVDESQVSFNANDEHSILTDLLLTSNLKGNIEQPGYYFANSDAKSLSDLDLVMLTHGYRHFSWKQVMNDEQAATAYSPEAGIEINGVAKSLSGKPLNKGKVTLIASNGIPLASQTTDGNGNFRFSNVIFSDSSKFMLKAVTDKGGTNTQITYYSPSAPSSSNYINYLSDTLNHQLQVYVESKKQQNIQNGNMKGKTLKEVKIQAPRKTDNYISSSKAGPGNADQVIHAEDMQDGGRLSDRLAGKMHKFHIVRDQFGDGFIVSNIHEFHSAAEDIAIVLNGVMMAEHFKIDDIPAQDVETIEVLTSTANTAVYGKPVLIITTKKGGQGSLSKVPSVGILPIVPKGYYKVREFYSPRYDSPIAKTPTDLRSTIYWQPEVVTQKDGNASFNYYTSDNPGSYRIIIEGMDSNGSLGRLVYKVKVQ